jgi:dihydropyrimidine dehydrogenase (NAD+) subunit PreT
VATDSGKLVVDDRGATGRPGVYAGGDGVNGGKEVVNAAAEGKAAAEAIHEFLTGGE